MDRLFRRFLLPAHIPGRDPLYASNTNPSRSAPSVDSQISTSAFDGGVVGSFRIGWLYRPISPENTTTVFLPPSAIVSSRLEDPRMCPASYDATRNSGLISKLPLRGMLLISFNVGSISSAVYSGSGLA